ncbi:MAG: flagellar motor protein MotB [Bacteroidetes bacterium]|nr:MAG: flagellar motor protein MotB [Bacteroidota bacterium]
MKSLFFFIFCSLFFSSIYSQNYSPSKVNKKAINFYNLALDKAQNGDFPEALQLLDNSLQADPKYVDAWLSKAGISGELKDYSNAVIFYEKAFALDTEYTKDYKLPYAIDLAGLGKFDKALEATKSFLADPDLNDRSKRAGEYRQKSFQFAVDYDQTHSTKNYVFAPHNLGDSVNSRDLEYYPSLTIDGKTIVFTRRVRNYNEDFFVSHRTDTGWTKAVGMDGDINTNYNEGAQDISQDGQWLVFTGCNFPEGAGGCDIYFSTRTKKGWGKAQNLGPAINTEFWESSPCLSPDKRELYFSSNRPGGYGGKDIYVSKRLPNGGWSDPENLGPTVNTAGDESCPFVHADNQTMYFTSNGHPGYGGDDLFMMRKQPDGTWGKVENLGYPINTIENEGSLVIAADGKTAYYASDRSDTRGGLDIYSFEIREDIRPNRTLWVQGKVFDKKTSDGLPSSVELIDLSSNSLLSKVQTDEEGNYLITLPVGKDYAFNVNRKGYLFYSQNFPLSQKIADSTYTIDIPLQPIDVNASIILKNIFFDVNKYDLKPESRAELDEVFKLLTDNPNVRISISGHTDDVGKAADNLTLSKNRANAVVAYLISKGIKADRLQANGFGATKPIADNKTEEGKAANRRTELTVISK